MAVLYDTYDITFAEVPDEISLSIAITNCQGRCEGCHSPHLRENIGSDLLLALPELLDKYDGLITCVCFLGEGNDGQSLIEAIKIANNRGLKTCLYSGRESCDIYKYVKLDYLKTGPYIKDLGGLTTMGTNQRMYKITYPDTGEPKLENITYIFRKNLLYPTAK